MPINAVIDLGTNTFHLIIAEVSAEKIEKILYREKRYVRLAENGIEEIDAPAYQRGLEAMNHYAQVLKQFKYDHLRAFGTEALRVAKNALTFIEDVREQTGIEVAIIHGLEEASWIHKGVKQVIEPQEEPYLIMDIGGGSCEFVLVVNNEVHWSHSFPIGVSVLHHAYHHSDPISEYDQLKLEAYLTETLDPLSLQLKRQACKILVGSSGTFDTILDLLHVPLQNESANLKPADFYPIHDWILTSILSQREAKKEIPEERVEYIVVAVVLIRQVLHMMAAKSIIISNYAMKEGILLGNPD
ncbi:MAG: hypothetical protein ABIV51_01945 [Saprospiraceae bacterium]